MKRNKKLTSSKDAKRASALIQAIKNVRTHVLRMKIENLEMNFEILSEMNKYEKRPEQHFKIIDSMKAQLAALEVLTKQEIN